MLVGTYRKPGKVLALFGDSRGKDVEFSLKVDTARLGLGKSPVFRDGESGTVLDGGKVKLPAWDLRIVEITSAPDTDAVHYVDGEPHGQPQTQVLKSYLPSK